MHAHSIPPKRAAQQYLYVMYHTFYVMMKKEASPCQYPSFFAPSLPGMKDFISRVHSEVHTELRANEEKRRRRGPSRLLILTWPIPDNFCFMEIDQEKKPKKKLIQFNCTLYYILLYGQFSTWVWSLRWLTERSLSQEQIIAAKCKIKLESPLETDNTSSGK